MTSNDILLSSLIQVIGSGTTSRPVHLHEPDFTSTNAWTYVKSCLDSGWVSSSGEWVNKFEQALCNYTNAKYAIAVNNGTSALRLALHLIGVQQGDEVLVPPLSFVATANAISHLGAIPHFVDIETSTLGMSPKALERRLNEIATLVSGRLINKETGRRISAVLPVHVFGNPAQIIALKKLASFWNLPIVEDSAEALGSWHNGVHCGLFGAIGIISFNGNKLITTGGGGALLTNSDNLAQRARHLSTTAKLPHRWEFEHDSIAWNDRMPNINAALGLAQLDNLESRLEAKQTLYARYFKEFSRNLGVELMTTTQDSISNNWLITLRFTDPDPLKSRDRLISFLTNAHQQGLLLRPVWKPLNLLPMYSNCPSGDLSISWDQSNRLVNLPSSPKLIR